MAELSILYSTACFGVFILEFIVNISEKGSVVLYPAIPAFSAFLAMVFFSIFLRKERKGTVILIFSLLFFALETAAELKLCSIRGFGAWCITILINAYLIITAFFLVTDKKKTGNLIGYFDWSLILLFFVLLLERSGSLKVISSIHFILCSLLCGLSLIRSRVISQNMSQSSSGGTLRVTAVSALLLAGASGLAVFTAKPFGALVISCIVFLRNAAMWILKMIERFLLWLSGFISPSKGDMGIMESAGSFSVPGEMDQPLPTNEYLFIALAVLICLALAIVLVITMKGMRFGRFKVYSTIKGKRVAKTSLLSLILKRIHVIIDAVRYRIYLYIHRDTVIGVYLNLESSLKRTPLERLSGETPEKFLTRCADAADTVQDTRSSKYLRELIVNVNECLYSCGSGSRKFPGAQEIRAWSSRRLWKNAEKSS